MALNRVAAKKIACYVGALTPKAMEGKQVHTLDDITRFIHKQMVSDIKTRINTILAIGIELGRVSQEGNRYKVNKGIVRLDRSLDNCNRKKRNSGRLDRSASKCRCRARALDKPRAPLFQKREPKKCLQIGCKK